MTNIYKTEAHENFINWFGNFIKDYNKLPLSIWIKGVWWAWKTTLFNSIENKLIGNKEFNIIKISAWDLVHTTNYKENLLYDIIKQLTKWINKGLLVKTKEWFSKNKISLKSDLIWLSINFWDYNEVEKLKKIIKDVLTNNNETIIILIDDLDRIEPSIWIELLETLQTFFFLKNAKVIFFIAFDEKIIEIWLKNKYWKENIDKFKEWFFSKLFDIYINPFLLDIESLKWFINEKYSNLYNINTSIYEDIMIWLLEIWNKNFRNISKIILKHEIANTILDNSNNTEKLA